MSTIEFNDLGNSDLQIDVLCEGGPQIHVGADPISKIFPCGNQGGFRYSGTAEAPLFCILYTSFQDLDWPDEIIYETGSFTYFGDNKQPGYELHDTPRKGNLILRNTFENLHTGKRQTIPPFFIFAKHVEGRDVIFKGLAVPGAENLSYTDDLAAIWKIKDGQRFQNYKATFTILDSPTITRSWINDIIDGNPNTGNAPEAWLEWQNSGKYAPLIAEPTRQHRTREEQLPDSKLKQNMLSVLINYFKEHSNREYEFEKCAADIAKLMDKNITNIDLTRPWRDGGRDGIGEYRIGTLNSTILVEFALEAKCYDLNNGCGVRLTSRLISRIKHRQFGIFVTTSYVSEQAYIEIIEDGHPILIISGRDIIDILTNKGINSEELLRVWLEKNYPNQLS